MHHNVYKMKGKSERRRRKNALDAVSGNLYKAQFGKASKWDALPDAPSAQQLKPWVPRSVQKIRNLMSLNDPSQVANVQTVQDKGKGKQSGKRGHASIQASQLLGTSGKSDAERPADSHASTGDSRAQHAAHRAGGGTVPEAKPSAAIALAPQAPPLGKAKLKRKEHLKQKKKLKRLKSQVARMGGAKQNDDQDSDFERDEVAFGEVAAAPPKANLKRRHWDAEQTAASNQNRHKEIMLKHLQAAEARAAKQGGSALTGQARRKALIDEQNHHQAVQAYREHRGRSKAGANLQTLKALVREKGSA